MRPVARRRLNLDDIGVHIGQQGAGHRASHALREVQNADPVERSRHALLHPICRPSGQLRTWLRYIAAWCGVNRIMR